METELGLSPPNPTTTLCLRGHKGKLTMMTPQYSQAYARYSCSSFLTALHSLAAVAYTKALLQIGEGKNAFSKILSYFCALLPDSVPRCVSECVCVCECVCVSVCECVSVCVHVLLHACLSQVHAKFSHNSSCACCWFRYVEPSLGFLTNFWQDQMDDISQSTHSIFESTLDRQSADARATFVRQVRRSTSIIMSLSLSLSL
jgi:hypothetical protein